MNHLDILTQLLLENKILLLFLVVATGYLIGKIRIYGFSFGISAVLFTGLAFGALHPDLALPDVVYTLGLVLFVYTMGLRSGASFFSSFRKSGLRDNALILTMLLLSAGLTLVLGRLFEIKNTVLAGLFCGALTNTPALASVIEILKSQPSNGKEALDNFITEPVVGYSLAYPASVMVVILLFQLGFKIWRIDLKAESKEVSNLTGINTASLDHVNVEITNPRIAGKTLGEVAEFGGFHHFVVSRHLAVGNTTVQVPSLKTVLQKGDVVTVVGPSSDLDRIRQILGVVSGKDLSLSADNLSMRRIFVSRQEIIGKSIQELDLYNLFQAVVTRLRRGDVDLPVSPGMKLESGDRVRVIAPKEKIEMISHFLGDSYQRLSEVDYISFSIGIVLGLLLGMVPIPLPNGGTFQLGFAAGPLLVALLLGKLGRSGNFIWIMSYNANFTLRQLGAVLFLAGIGLKAGYSFYTTLQSSGLELLVYGTAITGLTAGLTMLIARHLFKMPYALIMGMVSAMQTQPASLAFANEKDDTGAANISYAAAFPTAMVAKILLAQLILSLSH